MLDAVKLQSIPEWHCRSKRT